MNTPTSNYIITLLNNVIFTVKFSNIFIYITHLIRLNLLHNFLLQIHFVFSIKQQNHLHSLSFI